MERPPISSNFTEKLICALCFALAFALQIQITLFSSPTYLGLRVNAGDLILPFAGLGIAFSLFSGRSLWPQWTLKNIYIWLGALSLVFTAALLHGKFIYGSFSQWALINKYLGWFILLAILGMGGWIATNARLDKITAFIKYFLYFAMFVLIAQMLILILYIYEIMPAFAELYKHVHYPIDGFMANRNAYGLLIVTVFSMASIFYFSTSSVIHRFYTPLLYFCLPFFMLFNASRATLVALTVTIATTLILSFRQYKKIGVLIVCVITGFIFLQIVFAAGFAQISILKKNPLEFAYAASDADNMSLSEIGENVSYPGDRMRLTILEDAMEQIKQKPLIGSGLGSAMRYQEQKHGKVINLIDSTPIWLLVETGPIGMILFAAFYVFVCRSLWLSIRHTDKDDLAATIKTALLLTILGFTLMSLFHEILYTRFMWFITGLGLALPVRTRHPV